MAREEKELEVLIRQVGARLAYPPVEVRQLLDLLDETEGLLSLVEQSPSRSMLNALDLSIKSLVIEELFHHPDEDVKVAVTCCISELTRITAPVAPYDDAVMRDVLLRTVEAFEKLDEKSSRSYSKRVSILEIVARVRSCVIMLDLECDAMVLEMFRHFVRITRIEYSDEVLSFMGTIMTIILEESDDISLELLSCLLNCLKNDNQDVSPVARKLVEEVILNCASKLMPCFLRFFLSPNSLNGYGDIVESVWRGAWAQNESKAHDHLSSDIQEPKVGDAGEVTTAAIKSRSSIIDNGSLPKGDGDSFLENKPKVQKPDFYRCNDSSKDASSDMDLENKPIVMEESNPKKTDSSYGSHLDDVKEALELRVRRKKRGKRVISPHVEGPSVNEAESAASLEENVKPVLVAENGVGLPSSIHNENSHVTVPHRRCGSSGLKNLLKMQGNFKRSPLKCKSKLISIPKDGKLSKSSTVNGESFGDQKFGKRKRSRQAVSENVDETLSLKEMISLSKSARNTKAKEQVHSANISVSKSTRKATAAEVTPLMKDHQEPDETLVGCKIKVWWPDDKKFYAGVVDSYETETKRHKIIYMDGDVELLLLKEENWKPVYNPANVKKAVVKEGAEQESSLEVGTNKKAKMTSEEDSSNQLNKEVARTSGGGASKRRPPESGCRTSSGQQGGGVRGRPKGGAQVSRNTNTANNSYEKSNGDSQLPESSTPKCENHKIFDEPTTHDSTRSDSNIDLKIKPKSESNKFNDKVESNAPQPETSASRACSKSVKVGTDEGSSLAYGKKRRRKQQQQGLVQVFRPFYAESSGFV